jgi:hypothetical protein
MWRDDERPLSRFVRERIDAIDGMREKYRQGGRPSEMLREYVQSSPQDLNKILWIQMFREAFSLSLRQAHPIAGWAPDGTGYLQDEQLDGFLIPEIEECRRFWDHPGSERSRWNQRAQ